MIAVDLDGTLLSHEGRIGPRNRAALLAAEAAGIVVVIATGRRHTYALKVLDDAGLAPGTLLVSSNGAVVRRFNGELLERTFMQPGAALWLCGVLGDLRNALVFTFDRIGPDGDDEPGTLVVEELTELHASIDRWMIANAPYILHVQPIELALSGDAPIQAMLTGGIERMRRAEALLLSHPQVAPVGEERPGAWIALNRTEYPERDLSLVDILPAGCSKGAALLRLAAERGIAPAEIMAIGDNWNDISMLEIAGHPVLMGNAPDDLKRMAAERGWHIAAPHDLEGVADTLEDVLAAVEAATGESNELVGLTQ